MTAGNFSRPDDWRGRAETGDGAGIPYRACIPAVHADGGSCPLVLVLHGITEDEDFFFRVCGRNFLNGLAEKHGYLILSPRISRSLKDKLRLGKRGIVPAMKREAEARFRVSKGKFLLLGHSLGGFEAWGEASKESAGVTALACLAGSPPFFRPQKIRHIPVFVGVGTGDYMFPFVRATAWMARRAELPLFRYREVKGLDHVQIVRRLVPEIFRWFAGLLGRERKCPEQGSNL